MTWRTWSTGSLRVHSVGWERQWVLALQAECWAAGGVEWVNRERRSQQTGKQRKCHRGRLHWKETIHWTLSPVSVLAPNADFASRDTKAGLAMKVFRYVFHGDAGIQNQEASLILSPRSSAILIYGSIFHSISHSWRATYLLAVTICLESKMYTVGVCLSSLSCIPRS